MGSARATLLYTFVSYLLRCLQLRVILHNVFPSPHSRVRMRHTY
jgi:hypothetical protein